MEQHILRNYVFLHAIENGDPLPIGTQDASLLDARLYDGDADGHTGGLFDEEGDEAGGDAAFSLRTEESFYERAAEVYAEYSGRFRQRFKWVRPGLFIDQLADDLRDDAQTLIGILQTAGAWDAERDPDTPALPRHEKHHELVQNAVELVAEEEKSVGGQLGRPRGARFRTYERLKNFVDELEGTLLGSVELRKVVEDVYRYPLRQTATDILNRQLRSGISDEDLAHLVLTLRDDNVLCVISQEQETNEPRIICTMGLADAQEGT